MRSGRCVAAAHDGSRVDAAIAAATRAGAGQLDRGADERRRCGAWGYGAVQARFMKCSSWPAACVAGRGIRAIWTMWPPQHGQSRASARSAGGSARGSRRPLPATAAPVWPAGDGTGQLGGTLAVGQVAVVTDAVEAVGQDEAGSGDELVGISHHLALVVVAVVLPQEADASFVQADQATVGDRDAMGIAAEIVQDLFGPAERALGEDHPGRRPERPQAGGEGLGRSPVRQVGMELQPPPGRTLLAVL